MSIKRLKAHVKNRFFYVIGSLILFASIISFVYWVQQLSSAKMKTDGAKHHISVIEGIVRKTTIDYLTRAFNSLAKDIVINNKGIEASLGQLDVFNNMDFILDSALISDAVVYQERNIEKELARNFIYNEENVNQVTIYSSDDAYHYLQPVDKGAYTLYLIIDKKTVDNSVKNPTLITSLNKLLSYEIDHKLIYIVFFVGVVFVIAMLVELQSALYFVIHQYGELTFTPDNSLKNHLSLKKIVKSNIAQINKKIQDLSTAAFRDELTKLGNRNALRKELELLENKSQRSPATLVHIRLLELLSFRDQYGGNAMRKAIYVAVNKIKLALDKYKSKSSIRLYRVCEDELSLLIDSKERPLVDEVIKDLLDALSHKLLIETVSAKIEINMAIGVSIYPTLDKSLSNLINTAELSMQRASEDLNNNVVFFNELPQSKFKGMKIRSIDSVIKSALDANEFYLQYQPIFRHHKGNNVIVGFEALLRSYNKTLSQFNISEVIGAAEHGDVMAMLGRFVLHEATGQLKHWQNKKLINADVFISVNISTYQFFNDSLESLVLSTIRKADLEPKNLRLEFKQDIYKPHNKALRSSIKEVRENGVAVMLDDFDIKGLTYALQINNTVDGIKIHKKWLADAEQKKSFDLVTSMINMGKYLNIKIGVSGVESAGDIHKLAEIGCDEIQGYALSRPEDVDVIEQQLSVASKI